MNIKVIRSVFFKEKGSGLMARVTRERPRVVLTCKDSKHVYTIARVDASNLSVNFRQAEEEDFQFLLATLQTGIDPPNSYTLFITILNDREDLRSRKLLIALNLVAAQLLYYGTLKDKE